MSRALMTEVGRALSTVSTKARKPLLVCNMFVQLLDKNGISIIMAQTGCTRRRQVVVPV